MARRPNKPTQISLGCIEVERIALSILGTLFLTYGLIRRTVMGTVMLLSGIYMLVRGISGAPYLCELLTHHDDKQKYAELSTEAAAVPPEVTRGDEVTEAMYESFPASDPPAWTSGSATNR